jgi:hypothetical protein
MSPATVLTSGGDCFRRRAIRVYPFAFDVRHEHVGAAGHAVARVDALARLEADDCLQVVEQV